MLLACFLCFSHILIQKHGVEFELNLNLLNLLKDSDAEPKHKFRLYMKLGSFVGPCSRRSEKSKQSNFLNSANSSGRTLRTDAAVFRVGLAFGGGVGTALGRTQSKTDGGDDGLSLP